MVDIIKYITRQSHKPLILIPVILMILSLLYLGAFGLNEGVDLKGGTMVTVELKQSMTESQITDLVQSNLGVSDVKTSLSGNTATITISGNVDQANFDQKFSNQFNILSFRSVGALLSQAAMDQIVYALLFAFIFMAITVFFVFRDLVPSAAIVLSALCNISIAVGSMSLFGIPLSVASVGALLMLIGYGVDTDILLTTRLLKRHAGDLDDRAEGACRTGITLTFAALASMVVLFVVVKVFIPSAQVLEDISAVLIMGLLSDLLSTWLMNLGILKWHMERGGHN
ncbi:protein translocase subunit SecF [uncultured Methanosphaera sp.]|uniref:protein translocase subunit SecF n=1 Tax=uncultured Methanosphaera sp. TaxID=262501 RepID=UPI000DC3012F|nr:protein translocase subunit SecF [uncultured Methanosphaera sp.]RAP45211.1 MAG: preprotein translocase subunit SecF [Methanosphaera sp. SHI1033]